MVFKKKEVTRYGSPYEFDKAIVFSCDCVHTCGLMKFSDYEWGKADNDKQTSDLIVEVFPKWKHWRHHSAINLTYEQKVELYKFIKQFIMEKDK